MMTASGGRYYPSGEREGEEEDQKLIHNKAAKATK
jgi:hypothetical protein